MFKNVISKFSKKKKVISKGMWYCHFKRDTNVYNFCRSQIINPPRKNTLTFRMAITHKIIGVRTKNNAKGKRSP